MSLATDLSVVPGAGPVFAASTSVLGRGEGEKAKAGRCTGWILGGREGCCDSCDRCCDTCSTGQSCGVAGVGSGPFFGSSQGVLCRRGGSWLHPLCTEHSLSWRLGLSREPVFSSECLRNQTNALPKENPKAPMMFLFFPRGLSPANDSGAKKKKKKPKRKKEKGGGDQADQAQDQPVKVTNPFPEPWPSHSSQPHPGPLQCHLGQGKSSQPSF